LSNFQSNVKDQKGKEIEYENSNSKIQEAIALNKDKLNSYLGNKLNRAMWTEEDKRKLEETKINLARLMAKNKLKLNANANAKNNTGNSEINQIGSGTGTGTGKPPMSLENTQNEKDSNKNVQKIQNAQKASELKQKIHNILNKQGNDNINILSPRLKEK